MTRLLARIARVGLGQYLNVGENNLCLGGTRVGSGSVAFISLTRRIGSTRPVTSPMLIRLRIYIFWETYCAYSSLWEKSNNPCALHTQQEHRASDVIVNNPPSLVLNMCTWQNNSTDTMIISNMASSQSLSTARMSVKWWLTRLVSVHHVCRIPSLNTGKDTRNPVRLQIKVFLIMSTQKSPPWPDMPAESILIRRSLHHLSRTWRHTPVDTVHSASFLLLSPQPVLDAHSWKGVQNSKRHRQPA